MDVDAQLDDEVPVFTEFEAYTLACYVARECGLKGRQMKRVLEATETGIPLVLSMDAGIPD